ncbi:YlbF family regulator [Halostella sp. JP-L12]|uniref:YlbF family regulator n=1 Tax=Halostella TaxID=1843185 RepID=UPI000EF8048F|nr:MULTISPECIES: YlbF family regulator [Halostella]NHN49669.1 YlbF family regulator [Halostella sp. JP-L12]
MSIETDAGADTGDEDVESLGRELGEAITEMPEYEAFEEAKAAVEASDEAQEKIEEFEQVRQEFMLARQTGDASQEDLQQVQRKQQELHSVPVMSEYLEAQNELDARLEAINEAISAPLDVDFGEEAGGCCKD